MADPHSSNNTSDGVETDAGNKGPGGEKEEFVLLVSFLKKCNCSLLLSFFPLSSGQVHVRQHKSPPDSL